MLRQQRAQPVGNAVFELDRFVGRHQIAIEVAVAHALLPRISQRIGDGHEGDAAGMKGQLPGFDLADHATDRLGAAGFVAVHRAQHDEARTRRHAGKRHGLKIQGFKFIHVFRALNNNDTLDTSNNTPTSRVICDGASPTCTRPPR